MSTLLVIDDHTDIRENIAEILTLAGYNVLAAENGKQGVELALKEKIDLVVCDIMMPELDGYGVLHLLRKNQLTAYTPFIFLTAKTERADCRKGMEMGADDYITKPFDDIELLNAIEIRLKKYHLLQQAYAPGEQGVNQLIKDLRTSGLLSMQLEAYETLELVKKAGVYTAGKRPRYLYYLRRGKVKTFRRHEEGKEYITGFYGPGDFIGYLPLLENEAYNDSADVLEEAELVLVPKDEFLSVVYSDIALTARFVQLIAQDIKEKEERLLNLAYGSLRKRVARALLDIHTRFNKDNNNQQPLSISREDIAHYVGTATESLIRTLSDFKAEKRIEICEGKIRIAYPERLSTLLY